MCAHCGILIVHMNAGGHMKLLRSITHWLDYLVTPRIWAASLVIFLMFMIVILPHEAQRSALATGSDSSPDTSLFYTPEDLYDMADTYGSEGRAYYISSRFSFDIIWPIAYLLFLTCSITLVFRNLGTALWIRLVYLLPLLGFCFDLLENSAASVVMFRYPDVSPVAAFLAPWFTLFKWVSIAASFAGLAIGTGVLIRKALSNRSR